jgi:N-acyl-D-amino-acid deacylase
MLLGLFLLPSAPAGDKKSEKAPRTGVDNPALAPLDEMMEKFIAEHQVPGAALAVTKDGKLVYTRGFGYADPEAKSLVQPRSKFRIASISKPITAAAILRLIEMGKLKLDDPVFDLLALALPPGSEEDPRLRKITVRHCLQHTGGWDRAKSSDPMFRPLVIAKALGVKAPAGPNDVIRYMMGQKLDFAPGSRYAYSNFGYCVLGRVIEKVSGKSYEAFVRDEILQTLKMDDTRLGKTLEPAPGEVKYVDGKKRTAPAVVGPELGKKVPLEYGAWYLEAMDAHGGWLSSAPDLVRFASAFDRTRKSPILKDESIRALFARPEGLAGHDKDGKAKETYYGLGWQVVSAGPKGSFNSWHTGALDGTATILVRRHDGLDWAVLFNARADEKGRYLAALIDPLVHQAVDRVQRWPIKDLFEK